MRHGAMGVLVAVATCGAPALGQTITAPGPAVMEPTFADPAPAPGMLVMPDPASASAVPDHAVHGFVSTGISTHGGREVSGGVLVPIVPGRVVLDVSGGTGQVPIVTGAGRGTAKLSSYDATLHVKASDTVQVDVSVSGADLTTRGRLPVFIPGVGG